MSRRQSVPTTSSGCLCPRRCSTVTVTALETGSSLPHGVCPGPGEQHRLATQNKESPTSVGSTGPSCAGPPKRAAPTGCALRRTHARAPKESDEADARACHRPMPEQNHLRRNDLIRVGLPEGLRGAHVRNPLQVPGAGHSPTTAGHSRGQFRVSSDPVPAADDTVRGPAPLACKCITRPTPG